MTPSTPRRTLEKVAAHWNEHRHLTFSEAAKGFKMNRDTFKRYLKLAEESGIKVLPATNRYTVNMGESKRAKFAGPSEFEVKPVPEDDLPVEEIVEIRKREFAKKREHEEEARLRHVKVKIKGPIGLLHFGDPHIDDDGTDIGMLEQHSDFTHEEGVFGANVGDTTNNWVGRLARLYAAQNCGRPRAIKLAEWWIKRTRFLYMIGGNHDAWSGPDDPLKWIVAQSAGKGTIYQPTEARIRLTFPKGQPFTINARHDFAGGSQWNPTHGVMKSVQIGVRDDLSVCGHRHISGEAVLKDPDTGRACVCLQVGSYKVYDRYAKDKGFRDQSLGPAAMTIIQPELDPAHPDRCKVFWDPAEGIKYLRFLRS